ncbi:hypothetical protein MSAN_02133800 [Mycena sanguinolenta]|uniref:Uncharacterized protein n=1 Tax=Mycena sanguinolenta TaxID=230812 RepID=A0A8H6XHK0_9AGAR|nr:hypothetical protein MSAN_02133800 [Mycena sanguinolenta]
MANFEDYVDSDGKDFDADINSGCNSLYTDDYESECPPTSVCDDSDRVESSKILETIHDNTGSEDPELSNCEDHDASELTLEEDAVSENMFAPSRSLNVMLGIQLTTILFLGLFWVFEHVSISFT